MPAVNRGEIWMADFGMAAKVRPALLLTGDPKVDELDLVTVLLHTTALRGNRWELNIPKPFLKPGAFHFQQIQTISSAVKTPSLRSNLTVELPIHSRNRSVSAAETRFIRIRNCDSELCSVLIRAIRVSID